MLYDVIIVGAGPAGVAAGIYAARKKLKSLLITKDFGGQSVNSAVIENFIGYKSISGADFAMTLEGQLRAQEGIEIKDGLLVSSIKKQGEVFKVTDSAGDIYQTKTILYTAGSSHRKLDVKGEKEYEGKGVFYCSICDAPLMRNKNVVVVGGGNSALEAVIDLLPYASKIYLLARSEIKGDPVYLDKIKKDSKVEIITNANTEEIFGDTFVKSLRYQNSVTHEEEMLEVSGIFVSIGWIPNSGMIKEFVKLNDKGHVIVDPKTQQTSCPGIWVAGDVADGLYAQIGPAIGEGIVALLNIYDYLNKKG
jgi:alkyl hydroperoxide reductase subunit F